MTRYTEKEVYDDYLYLCYLLNQDLTPEEWEYHGREEHHIEIPDRDRGLLTPLNSQHLTTYQHWVAGVLQSEVLGKKCYAFIPKGHLPGKLEVLRIKWDADHVKNNVPLDRLVEVGKSVSPEFLSRIGAKGGSRGKGTKRGPHTEDRKANIGRGNKGKTVSEESRQKCRENAFDCTGFFWVTDGTLELWCSPGTEVPLNWRKGRKSTTRKKKNQL